MSIELLLHTPLSVAVTAGRTAWDSHRLGGQYNTLTDDINEKDIAFLTRLLTHKHLSVLEHLNYTFKISNISRAVLQEIARHRIQSLTVKSTRYTLKELKKEDSFISCNLEDDAISETYKTAGICLEDLVRAEQYLVFTDNEEVNVAAIQSLDNLRMLINKGYSNDKVKYALPESFKTSLTLTINARSLINLLILRTSPSALAEFRDIAKKLFTSLPEQHKFLFIDSVSSATQEEVSKEEIEEHMADTNEFIHTNSLFSLDSLVAAIKLKWTVLVHKVSIWL